jgi:hypothetical protein
MMTPVPGCQTARVLQTLAPAHHSAETPTLPKSVLLLLLLLLVVVLVPRCGRHGPASTARRPARRSAE